MSTVYTPKSGQTKFYQPVKETDGEMSQRNEEKICSCRSKTDNDAISSEPFDICCAMFAKYEGREYDEPVTHYFCKDEEVGIVKKDKATDWVQV